MRKLRSISLVILLLGGVALGTKLRTDWRVFRESNDPAVIKARPMPPEAVPTAAPAPDYSAVATQNPFHPERNDQLPPPPPTVQKTVGPPPLVYGSMLIGKEKFALMATDADPKPRKVVEGTDFNGYKLKQVKEQSVVLEADGTSNEVMFYNALSRLRRDGQKTQSASGGTPAPTSTVANGGAVTSAPPTQQAAVTAPVEAPPLPAGSSQANKKLVQTPFGPIWVDK